MEQNNILLSFKGDVTSELLTSVLSIIESKLDIMQEDRKVKKKVYNVLVECLQNLYHHMDEVCADDEFNKDRSAIFMVGKLENEYNIFTGNYILSKNVTRLKNKIDEINLMDKEELKTYYKMVLNNGQMSDKGGGGLGIIDIARKSGQKLQYEFTKVDDINHFFSLNVKIVQEFQEEA
jgi:hypothetical protein